MYTIDREADTPLYMQIRDRIISAIQSSELKPGDKLPSVAALAREIGVTQTTIRRALQDLGDAGYTDSHVGRGTFICESTMAVAETEESESHGSTSAPSGTSRPNPINALQFAGRRLRSGIKKALFDIMPLAHKPGIIQLTRGVPDDKLLAPKFLEDVTQETLAGGSQQFIQATEELGLAALRQEIARRFNEDGNAISADQVLITNGAIQGVALVAQAFMEKQPGIICETPCFQGIPDTFTAMGHWVETVPRDENGPHIEKLHRFAKEKPHLLYLCPFAHNPTGTDLSPARYQELTSWARKTGSIIVADEIFKDLGYENTLRPSLFKELGGEQTVVVSSLSKSVMTGLRMGWIISSRKRIQELAQLKRLMDHSTPSLIQGMALTILTSGRFDSHTDTMRTLYRKRMETMLGALKTHMPPGVTWTLPSGGFSLLLELPKGYSSVALLLLAVDNGVSFLPGPLFDIDQRYVHTLRLSTAWSNTREIREGIELLAGAIEEYIRRPPEDSGLSGLGNFQ